MPKDLWMTSNRVLQRGHMAALRRELNNLAQRVARSKNAHVTMPCDLTIWVSTPQNRRFDPPNAYPTVKPLIDGLVDFGVLDDDSWREIPATCFRRGTPTRKKGQYRIRMLFTPAVPVEEPTVEDDNN